MNFKSLKEWWHNFKEGRRNNEAIERVAEVENSLQLTTSNGRAYIAHKGVGVRELDPTLTLGQAIQILTNMREDAVKYTQHEENLF